jgi:hypothetical protein
VLLWLGPVSRNAGRLEEEHRLFCPAHLYGAAVFFVEGGAWSGRNEHVWSVNESGRHLCIRKVGGKEPAHGPANESAERPTTKPRRELRPMTLVICRWQLFFLLTGSRAKLNNLNPYNKNIR